MKTMETTYAVSSRGVGDRAERHKSQRSTPLPEKNRGRTGNETCKLVAREENHEKAPRRSWAKAQMGNSR